MIIISLITKKNEIRYLVFILMGGLEKLNRYVRRQLCLRNISVCSCCLEAPVKIQLGFSNVNVTKNCVKKSFFD